MPVLALRLPWSIVAARRKPALALTDTSELALRVRITDTDWFGHMNNGRFLTNLDLGRTDFSVRSGLLDVMQATGWRPVVGGITVRFRRSLQTFRRYHLTTRLLGCDEQWWYFEQELYTHERKLAGRAWVKIAILADNGRGGRIPSATVLEQLGGLPESLQLPDAVAEWQKVGVG